MLEIGRQCTRDDMAGIYSMLAKLISPQSLLHARWPRRHDAWHREISAERVDLERAPNL